MALDIDRGNLGNATADGLLKDINLSQSGTSEWGSFAPGVALGIALSDSLTDQQHFPTDYSASFPSLLSYCLLLCLD